MAGPSSGSGRENISTSLIWKVIGTSSVGTMIEWYDFYIFGSLAPIIAPLFYPPENQTFAYIAYLATFAVGFIVRPFGALFFGRIGDLIGRKVRPVGHALIMGGATAMIGILPTYPQIGVAAPITLLVIRVLQGLALGGQYGGAAVYVAEHVPDRRRGFYTSVYTDHGVARIFSFAGGHSNPSEHDEADEFSGKSGSFGGWRIAFLLSLLLVGISLYIRSRMAESPIFEQMKSSGMTSANPLVEAFTKWENLKLVLISLSERPPAKASSGTRGSLHRSFTCSRS